MPYKPYPIYDLKEGKMLSRDPWLLPGDAFETLNNCHLKDGILEKRRGYEEFGRFAHTDTITDNTPDGSQTDFSGTATNTPLRAGDFDVQDVTLNDDSTESFTDNGDGTVTGDQGASGTYNVTTGAWVLDFSGSLPPKNATAITINYDHYPGNAIMGIWNYLTSSGTEKLMVFDKKRLCIWNVTTEKFEDKAKPDSINFTGDNANFFWVQNWEQPAGTFKAYICNNKDRLYTWDGTNLAVVNVDIDGDATNELNNCLLVFVYHNRLILLRTNEDGTSYYQRARWSSVAVAGQALSWDDTITGPGYKDAPTEDWIIGADLMGGELIVFFERSVRKLVYTGDAEDPFDWEEIDNTEGAYATMSIVSFSDELQAIGPTRVIATDGREVYGIDEKIPNFMLQWRQEGVPYCYGLVLEEMKQAWETYPSLSVTVNADGNYYPDSVLVLNYSENSYSTYTLPAHCLGYSILQSDVTWDDITLTWDEIDWEWDARELQAGYPTTLMGGRDGWVYKLNSGGSDNGVAIEFNAKSGRWNPFFKQGLKANLGWIDFLVDVGTERTFDVKSYINTQTSPFQTKTVACTSVDGASGKVWKRIWINSIANFHRIELTNNASGNRPRIHAIVPFFKEAGQLI